MASHTHAKSVHRTLTGTTADTVAITGFDTVDIVNREAVGGTPLYVSYEGDASPDAAVAEADGTDVVLAGAYLRVDVGGADGGKVSVVGNGNDYSVVGVSA